MVVAPSRRDAPDVELRHGESLGDFDPGAELYGEADPLWRAVGESARTVWSLVGLGQMARRQGAYERSQGLCEEAMALGQAVGFTWGVALALRALAEVDLVRGDLRRAAGRYIDTLALAHAEGDGLTAVGCLARLATLARALGQAERAARLGGTLATLCEAHGFLLAPEARAEYDRAMTAAREELGPAAFAAAEAAGRALRLQEATAEAVAVASLGPSARRTKE